LKYFKIVLNLS